MFQSFLNSLLLVPAAWDRFWFSAISTRAVSTWRVAVAIVALLHFLSFLTWVPQWLAGDGWFDLETGRYLIGEGLPDTGSQYRWSPLFALTQPAAGYAVCIVGLLASVSLVLGIGSRITPAMCWLCLLTIHHRAPWLSTPGEILLAAGLFYLILDPGRTAWSIKPGFDDGSQRVSAQVALRCGQIHLLMWLLFSLLSMLQHPVWWNGSAVALMSEQVDGWLGAIPRTSYFGQALTLIILGLQIATLFLLTRQSTLSLGLLCLACFAFIVAIFAGDGMYAMTLLAMGVAFLPGTWADARTET
jgi:hypothetical protein